MNDTAKSLGFITYGFGKPRFLRQAENLALSLRYHMPGIPLALVSDLPNIRTTLFDLVIPLNRNLGPGTIQKLNLYEYSPFEHTLYIDSDCICVRSFHAELEQIQNFDFTAVGNKYLTKGMTDEYLENLDRTLDLLQISRFPKFNAGVYYFVRSAEVMALFEKAKKIHQSRAALGLKSFDRNGPNDETVIGLAMEASGMSLFNDEGNLMKTPLAATSAIALDPLGSGCSFKKSGRTARPAVLHFCGPWSRSLEYRFCAHVFRSRPAPRQYRRMKVAHDAMQWLIRPVVKALSTHGALPAWYRWKRRHS